MIIRDIGAIQLDLPTEDRDLYPENKDKSKIKGKKVR